MARGGRGRKRPRRPNAAPLPSSAAPPADLGLSSTNGARHDTTPPPVQQGTASPLNYASIHDRWEDRFYEFLTSSRVYEAQLPATTHMNKNHGTSDPYTLEVSYQQMWKLGAHADLITATCNSIKNPHVWLLPAVKRFLRDNGCVCENIETCLSFTGFPERRASAIEARDIISSTSTVTDVKHNTPPPDAEVRPPARTYAGILMADHRSLPMHDKSRTLPSSRYRTSNVAGTFGSDGLLVPQKALPPSLQSLDNHSYSSKEDEDGFILSKLHAAQRIPADGTFEKEEVPIIQDICEPYVGCLKSIESLGGFLSKHDLVRPVEIFGGKMTIQLATAQGRLLFHIILAAILECHSQNKSWNGTFHSNQVRIIKPCHSKQFVMILQVPVEFEGNARLLKAMANDLRRVAEIFIPLYKVGNPFRKTQNKVGNAMPPYFLELKEDLEGVTGELLAKERTFMEHLSYHPAIMPSAGRGIFMTKLSSVRKYCNVLWHIMLSRPCPNDWKEIVESEVDGNKNDKDRIKILYNVYYYNKQPGNEYENTRRGLSRFLRNVLEHGKEHDARVNHGYELELYLAEMFSRFLPTIVRTLLDSGKMEQYYGEDWSTYKMSKSNEWEPAWAR